MRKVKVMYEGKEIEVELPQGYLSPDEVSTGYVAKAATEQIVTDRLARAMRTAKKELLEDEEFRTEALTAWNIKPGDKGTGKATPAEIDAALKEYERTTHAPILKENEALKGRIGSLTRSQLHAQILAEAAAVGVAKHYLKPVGNSKTPAIIGMFEPQFGFDEQIGDWLVRGADGKSYAVSGEANAAHPYKGVKHFFTDLSKDPDARSFFEAAQSGAGVQTGGAGGSQKVIAHGDAKAFGENAADILAGKVAVQ